MNKTDRKTSWKLARTPEQVMDLIPVRPLGEDDAVIKEMYWKRLPALYQKLKG
jgi:hypothetical protein